MPETRLGVSAPDVAVGACARVRWSAQGANPAVSAAPAQARPGTSENVWVSRCFLPFLAGYPNVSEKGQFVL